MTTELNNFNFWELRRLADRLMFNAIFAPPQVDYLIAILHRGRHVSAQHYLEPLLSPKINSGAALAQEVLAFRRCYSAYLWGTPSIRNRLIEAVKNKPDLKSSLQHSLELIQAEHPNLAAACAARVQVKLAQPASKLDLPSQKNGHSLYKLFGTVDLPNPTLIESVKQREGLPPAASRRLEQRAHARYQQLVQSISTLAQQAKKQASSFMDFVLTAIPFWSKLKTPPADVQNAAAAIAQLKTPPEVVSATSEPAQSSSTQILLQFECHEKNGATVKTTINATQGLQDPAIAQRVLTTLGKKKTTRAKNLFAGDSNPVARVSEIPTATIETSSEAVFVDASLISAVDQQGNYAASPSPSSAFKQMLTPSTEHPSSLPASPFYAKAEPSTQPQAQQTEPDAISFITLRTPPLQSP